MPEGLLLRKNLSDPIKTFHSFLITRENGSQVYGSALTFFEQVREPRVLNVLESLQTSYLERHHRGLGLDKRQLFNRVEDKIYALKCISFVTSKPFFRPCHAYLEQLFAVTVGAQKADLPLESYLYNILYEVSMPSPGKAIQFFGPLGQLYWRLPTEQELPLCDHSFKDFFELLGVRSMLVLLTSVLLEHQILFKSSGRLFFF